MKKFRIKISKKYIYDYSFETGEGLFLVPNYQVQGKILCVWVNIRSFASMNEKCDKYAAERLLNMLNKGK